MMPLWTAAQIAAATGGETWGFDAVTGIALDSGAVRAGDLFVDLREDDAGVAQALSRGAGAVLVTRPRGAGPMVVVDDAGAALAALAAAAKRRSNARVIVVAGGGDGTVETLRRVLERQGRSWCPAASDGPWALPFALAGLPANHLFAIFTLPQRHGEIARWCAALRPRVAMIGTDAADAAAAIFPAMAPYATAVVAHDGPHLPALAAAARVHGGVRLQSYGLHPAASIRLVDCHLHQSASAVTASVVGDIIDYCVAYPGRDWVLRSLAVLCAVAAADGDIAAAAAAMGTLGRPSRGAAPERSRVMASLVKG